MRKHKCCKEYQGGCDGQVNECYDVYGIYAGRFCAAHWRQSGIRTWSYDYSDAGEYLEADY